MKVLISLIVVMFLFTVTQSWADTGTGLLTYPLEVKQKTLTTEFTGVTSTGGGVGVQGRFTMKPSRQFSFDAGIGIAGGEYSSKLFVSGDYEIFPDYMKQPRFSIRTAFENAKEGSYRKNILSLAPVISKGMSFWGKEAYPFASMPIALNLNNDKNTYRTTIDLNMGLAMKLPIKQSNLLGTIETSIGLKDSNTGFALGVAYSL